MVGDEGNVAPEVDLFVVASQDRPLNHFAGDRIADTFFYVARLRQIALARQRDCCLDSGENWRRKRRSGGIGRHRVPFYRDAAALGRFSRWGGEAKLAWLG